MAPKPRVLAQAFTFSPGNLSYSENFDGMGSGTAFVPGWTSTDSTMSVSSGTSTTGGIYNVGPNGGGDRAFGSLASGTTMPVFGAVFANTTGAKIDSLVLSGVMEQWRTGNNAVVEETPFEFSLDATSLTDGTWLSASSFNLVEKIVTSTTGGAVDGNLDANRTAISARTNVNWNSGTAMWIRWSDIDNAGNDGLYAIDDFSLSVTTAAPPLYWDLNGNTPGLGGTVGIWDGSMANWSPDPAGSTSTQTFNSANAAYFSGRAGTVQIATNGVTAAGGVTFETEGYVINGGPLTLGPGPVATTHASGTSTINAIIAGSNGLTKTGVGTLKIGGANTFSGTILVTEGRLQISTDANLGTVENDLVVNGGALEVLDNVTLNVGRDFSGTGTISIAEGRTLTVNGAFNCGTLTLPSPGNLVLAGPSNTISTLNISVPLTISAAAPIAINGGVVSSQTTGTTTLEAPVLFPGDTPQFTVSDGPNIVDFLLNGIISGVGRLLKLDEGTLRLTGNNSGWSGSARLGVAGSATIAGGRILIAHQNALGTGADVQMQFNDGILEAETPFTGANAIPIGLSIGAGQLSGAVFAGAEMEFMGTVQLFKPAGPALQNTITVNNHVTFTGSFGLSTGTGPSLGVTIAGPGMLTLANASNPVSEPFTIDGPTVIISGSLGASSVTIKAGTLKGGGSLLDLFVGDAANTNDAILAPGNGIGILTTSALTLDSDAILELEVNSALGVADKIVAAGAVALGDGVATLAVTDLGAGILAAGTSFTIIDNQSATSGTIGFFKNRPDLSRFALGVNQFEIDYESGIDLNDVVLRVVPEPSWPILLIWGGALFASRRRLRSEMPFLPAG